jgi:hypothetical protein
MDFMDVMGWRRRRYWVGVAGPSWMFGKLGLKLDDAGIGYLADPVTLSYRLDGGEVAYCWVDSSGLVNSEFRDGRLWFSDLDLDHDEDGRLLLDHLWTSGTFGRDDDGECRRFLDLLVDGCPERLRVSRVPRVVGFERSDGAVLRVLVDDALIYATVEPLELGTEFDVSLERDQRRIWGLLNDFASGSLGFEESFLSTRLVGLGPGAVSEAFECSYSLEGLEFIHEHWPVRHVDSRTRAGS